MKSKFLQWSNHTCQHYTSNSTKKFQGLIFRARKYEQSHNFGVITSALSNIEWVQDENIAELSVRDGAPGKAFVGANEEVICWNVKKGELVNRWRDRNCAARVTVILRNDTDKDIFAVGYADGSIRLWDSMISNVVIKFDGHRSAITHLAFDRQGTRLASGSQDTDIILWDLVKETSLFRLRGHKDQITGLHFVSTSHYQESDTILDSTSGNPQMDVSHQEYELLLSSSRDALLKLWDLNSQFCIETHATQSNGECWTMGIFPDHSSFITGGNEGELKIWSIDHENLNKISSLRERGNSLQCIQEIGVLYRRGKDRTVGIQFHRKTSYLALHGSSKSVEIWRIRRREELQRISTRKRRRARERLSNEYQSASEDKNTADDGAAEIQLSDIFVPHVLLQSSGKVHSVVWGSSWSNNRLEILISMTNNQLEVYSVPLSEGSGPEKRESVDCTRVYSIDLEGHRTDVRAMALSSDDRMLATASNGTLKVWNTRSIMCLRTFECGYALCCTFLPGDKIILVGNRSGDLELFDTVTSSLIDTIRAHEGSVWALKVCPLGKYAVTGGTDKTVKFWDFQILQENIPGTSRIVSRLRLIQSRILKLNDEVLSLSFSPDSRLLAIATLDSTVKVFLVDSLKLFLVLHGHKLPVLSVSISSDSTLIATSSADKNLRIWGLDFGDCHKSFFAHEESVMQVGFIPHPVSKDEGHIVFTTGKDNLLKTWDAQKFQHIQKLNGHHGEIWAMVISQTGEFVITSGHDKSIRIWSQTNEPLFLEEERERELEEVYENALLESLVKDGAGELDHDDNEANSRVGIVSAVKQTLTTLNAGEKITEALVMCSEDLKVITEFQAFEKHGKLLQNVPPNRNPLLALHDVSAEDYLLSVFEAVPSPALHDTLLLLPFSTLSNLLTFVEIWLRKSMNVHISSRVLSFLLKTHHKQIVASRELRLQLESIRVSMRRSLGSLKDMVGFNVVALIILGQRLNGKKLYGLAENLQISGAGAWASKKRAFINVG